MIHSHILLSPLPISKHQIYNIKKKNNKTTSSYFKAFLTINITPLYVSLTHTIINLTNFKPTKTKYLKTITTQYLLISNHS
jgi:hypothetical protein